MMSSKLMWSAMLGCALMLGCDDNTETPAGVDATNPQATEEAADAMTDKTENASERAKEAAEEAGGVAETQAENASDALKDNAAEAANAANANPAAAEASAQIKSVMDSITAENWTAAETTLTALEAQKASLPAATQAQIDNARKMLDAGKAGVAADADPAAPAAPVTPAAP